MHEADITAGLAAIFADAFGRDDLVLRPGLTARHVPGWDSFKHIEIILAVEQRFGIKATSRDLDALHSVADLIALIARGTA